MPLPHDHDLRKAQHLTIDGEKPSIPHWFCNCQGQPGHRTLRWAAANRDKVSVWPPRVPIQPKDQP